MAGFGFTVERGDDWYEAEPEEQRVPDTWRVFLPHSCDAWAIAGENYDAPPSHAEAVTALRQFIDEATEALQHLEDRETYGAGA